MNEYGPSHEKTFIDEFSLMHGFTLVVVIAIHTLSRKQGSYFSGK